MQAREESKTLTKSRTLGLWTIVLIANYIATAQTWLLLEMAPNGTTVQLGSFDGFTTYSFLSPILLVCLAALFASLFLGGVGRKIAGLLGLAANLSALGLLVPRLLSSDVSGLAPQIEQLTGIAATHGIKDLTVLVLPWAWISVGTLALLALIQGFFLLTERKWPKKAAKSDKYQTGQTAKDENDTIGLWDSQR